MPKKILLADDSVTIQKVVELTFSEGDYQVTCVSNGKMAVDQLNANRPDIIICDIIMPELSGYDVAELVKRNPLYQAIPVILLTGTFEPFDEDRARKSGAEAYVTKPFDSKMLVDKVESLLAQKVQFQAVQTIAPATIVQGGKEYELPGVVSDEAVRQMDAQIHQKPGLENYDFPDSPVIDGELPAVAPPPPEESSFESPVVEDLAMPADKGEPEELKGFDAIMEPPEQQDIEPPSALEVTASSVPEGTEGFRTEIPPELPTWQEPELPETALSQEAVQPPEVAVEPPPVEEPKEEFLSAEIPGPEVPEPKIEESMIPDLPETGAVESDISIGELPAETTSAVETPAVDAVKFFEPPVFEAPPALQMEESGIGSGEEPKAFMDIPPALEESMQVVPTDASVLVTDLNEQAMMVAEGQKKIDEEKAEMPREEEPVEEAREYPIREAGEEAAEVVEEEAAPPAEEDVREQPRAELQTEPQPAPAAASPSEIAVSPEMLEEIVRKVVAELAPGIVTDIAWEVIPELANSLIKKRIEELEKEAE